MTDIELTLLISYKILLMKSCFYSAFIPTTVLLILPLLTVAQETDSTNTIEKPRKERKLELGGKNEHSISPGNMSQMGTYEVPTENPYLYKRPFKGQEYLDMALEAYRKKMKEEFGPGWQSFMQVLSPFIHLRFSTLESAPLPIPDRDNPLQKSYNSNKKKQ